MRNGISPDGLWSSIKVVSSFDSAQDDNNDSAQDDNNDSAQDDNDDAAQDDNGDSAQDDSSGQAQSHIWQVYDFNFPIKLKISNIKEIYMSALIALSYLAVIWFAVGVIYRGRKIAKMPVHLRWELAPVPKEKGRAHYGGSYFEEYEWWTKPRQESKINELWYMFLEIVFMKGVWERKRSLWYLSFPFHFGGLYVVGGAIGLCVLAAVLQIIGVSSAPVTSLAGTLAGIGYFLGACGVLGLFIRRIVDYDIQSFSTFASYFNLIFLFSIYITGLMAVISMDSYAPAMAGFIKSALTLGGTGLPGWASLHVVLGALFLMYLPFSYMMHFVAKYFTYHEVRWNDTHMTAGSKMEKEVTELLGQKVSWAAKHIKGEGTKTWVDIATSEGEE